VSDRDPYAPPTKTASWEARRQPLNLAEYVLLGLVLLQILFDLRYTGPVLEWVRTGALNIPFLLSFASSVALLALGGVLTLTKSRRALYAYALAMLMSIVALWPLRPVFAVTGVIVSLAGCVISLALAIKARS
jgi:hypothetical protein